MGRTRGFLLAEVAVLLTVFSTAAAVTLAAEEGFERLCVGSTPTSNEVRTEGAASDAKRWVCVALSRSDEVENHYVGTR